MKQQEQMKQEQLKQEQQMKQEQQKQEQSSSDKRKVFGKNQKKGNRIKSQETKNYETIQSSSTIIASDSENEMEDEKLSSSLPIQNVDDFYNDKCKVYSIRNDR